MSYLNKNRCSEPPINSSAVMPPGLATCEPTRPAFLKPLPEDKAPPVESAVNRLASLLSSLASAVDRCEEKLHAVLQPLGPSAGERACKEQALSPLAEDLHSLSDRAEAILDRVRGLVERVEV